MSKIIGYLLFAISCILFGLILAVPWLNYSKSTIVWISTSLFVGGEVLFYVSIFLIGKDFIYRMINKLKFWKTKDDTIEQKNVE
jgi:uncharacterized membrane protein YbhN (UPF0104 family)